MVAIIDYNAGNLTSVKRALDFIGVECEISSDRDVILNADRVVFPGVGHAQSSMAILKDRGLDTALNEAYQKRTPILGICLGTQIILSHSDEGNTQCLGLIEGNCPKFELSDPNLKIPHMGWDGITIKKPHPLLSHVQDGDEFYFVHSFYPSPGNDENVIATCEYEITFPAAIGNKNLFASQFHPEKSGKVGMKILENFCNWDGKA